MYFTQHCLLRTKINWLKKKQKTRTSYVKKMWRVFRHDENSSYEMPSDKFAYRTSSPMTSWLVTTGPVASFPRPTCPVVSKLPKSIGGCYRPFFLDYYTKSRVQCVFSFRALINLKMQKKKKRRQRSEVSCHHPNDGVIRAYEYACCLPANLQTERLPEGGQRRTLLVLPFVRATVDRRTDSL